MVEQECTFLGSTVNVKQNTRKKFAEKNWWYGQLAQLERVGASDRTGRKNCDNKVPEETSKAD